MIVTKEVRKCGFCGSTAKIIEDTERIRRYECSVCKATEKIAKSKNAGWWYFGWSHPDGQKLRAPTVEEMREGKYGWQPETEK